MSQSIEHIGKIVAIKEQTLFVEIENAAACGGCRARALCFLSDREEKLIQSPILPHQQWNIGEEVVVSLQSSLGLKAVLLMYVLPLIALLTVLFTLPYFNVSELVTGLCALVAPLFCYFAAWLFRERIEKRYTFVLEKLNPA